MFQTVISALNEGFVQTLKLFVVTLVGSIPLGLIICFGSMSRWAPLGLPGRRLAARKAALDRQLEEDGEPIVDGGRVLSPVSARKKSGATTPSPVFSATVSTAALATPSSESMAVSRPTINETARRAPGRSPAASAAWTFMLSSRRERAATSQ